MENNIFYIYIVLNAYEKESNENNDDSKFR